MLLNQPITEHTKSNFPQNNAEPVVLQFDNESRFDHSTKHFRLVHTEPLGLPQFVDDSETATPFDRHRFFNDQVCVTGDFRYRLAFLQHRLAIVGEQFWPELCPFHIKIHIAVVANKTNVTLNGSLFVLCSLFI